MENENEESKGDKKDSAKNTFDNTNNDVGEYKHKETERIQKQLAQITNGKHVKTIEVHYYFCPTIGKIEFKLKVK